MSTDAPYRSLTPTSRWAIRALVVTIAVNVAIAVHDVADIRMLDREIAAPGSVSDDRLALSDSIVLTLTGLEWAFWIISVVAFLLWFRRAAANLPALGDVPRYSPAWSVGMWFVPFVNWVLPKRAANDAWRAGTNEEPPRVLNLWWAAWIVNLLVSRALWRESQDAESMRDFRAVDELEIAAVTINAVAAVLAIMVIRAVNRRQEERHALGPIPVAPARPELRAGPASPPQVRDDDEFSVPPAWGRAPESAEPRFTRDDDRVESRSGD